MPIGEVRTRRITICRHRTTERKPGRWRVEFAKIDAVHVLDLEEKDGRRRMAAEAWVKCVGINRRAALVKLGAPDVLLRAPTDLDKIMAQMTPTSLAKREAFLFTNSVETYLLVFSPESRAMPRRNCSRLPRARRER